MSQSSITIWALLALFFVFITVRGELPAYMGVFIGSSGGGSTGTTGHTVNTAQNVLGTAGQIGSTIGQVGSLADAFGFGNQDFSGGTA